MYTAMNIASEVIHQYAAHSVPITNLKLQKVLYYTQMYSLQTNGCALFADDFQAWRHGPVVPGVYEQFRKYVCMPIESGDPCLATNRTTINDYVKAAVTFVTKSTLYISPWDMVAKTQATKPWQDTYVPGATNVISKDRIRRDGVLNFI